MRITKHKDHMMKFTSMARKSMRAGQRRLSTAISRMVSCRQLSKRLPDNSTIFAGQATAITLILSYYRHIGLVHHVFAGNWRWNTENPSICHTTNLFWLLSGKRTCPFLLDTTPLWHRGEWKSGPTSKRDPRTRYRPTGKCPLYRFEATGQLLRPAIGLKQVRCSSTWQRSLSRETKFQHLARDGGY